MQITQTEQTSQNQSVLSGFYPEAFNQMQSVEVYKKFIGLELPGDKLFVVLGTDSGLMLDYLKTIAKSGQRFIVIDFPEVIEHIKQTRGNLLNSQSTFKFELHTFEEFTYEYLYQNYQDYVIRNAIILLSSYIASSGEGCYQGIYETQKELFHRFQIDRVDNHDFKKVFDQQLESSVDLMHPLADIKGQLKGDVPGIVLGGGPSLDKVIPWLKTNQNKLWIFAASRICKRLQKEGITPDFIGVFDGQPLILEYSKEMYEFQSKSILITGEHPYRQLIRQWAGLKVYSRRRFPWAKGSEGNFISDGPTVTNALFGIAAYLGVSNFYLAGVDFCFTLDGVCHESGSIESKNQQRDNSDTRAINYRGEEVATNIQLYDARNLFEEQFLRLRKTWPNLQVHNLNDGAAVMQDIDYQPIAKVEFGRNKFNVVETFSEQLQFDAQSEKRFQNFLKKEVSSHIKWFLEIAQESKKGLHLTSTLFKDSSKLKVRTKEVLKLKTKLEKLAGDDYQTMVNYGYQAFMNSLKPVESEADMSEQEMTNALTGFFGGLNRASNDFIEKLNETQKEIEFREQEIDPKVSFELLAEYWLENNMPGRFIVWLEHYATESYEFYKKTFPEYVERLETDFKRVKTDESALERNFNQRLESPDDFVIRLQTAYTAKSLQDIRDISRQLMFAQSEEYGIVKSFANGLLLELKEAYEDALIHYLAVDPDKYYYIIQQQVYPIAFSLHKNEEGLAALKTLSEFDLRYTPKYAEALSILGHVDAAIDVYLAYPLLDKDTDALIHLLGLLVQLSKIEMANELLQKADGNQSLDQSKLEAFVESLNSP